MDTPTTPISSVASSVSPAPERMAQVQAQRPPSTRGTDMDVDERDVAAENLNGSGQQVELETITIPSTGLAYWEHRRACFLAGLPFPEPRTPAPFANPPLEPDLGTPSACSSGSGSYSTPSSLPSPRSPPVYSPHSVTCPTSPPPPPQTQTQTQAATLPTTPLPVPSTAPLLPKTYTVKRPPPLRAITAAAPPTPLPHSVSRLEALLEFEDGEVAWNGGVGTVHRNLTGGRRLAKRLRLGLVIKVLRAGWVRDGTWPTDARGQPLPAPESPIESASPTTEGLESVPVMERL